MDRILCNLGPVPARSVDWVAEHHKSVSSAKLKKSNVASLLLS